jgi:hypothetical protein
MTRWLIHRSTIPEADEEQEMTKGYDPKYDPFKPLGQKVNFQTRSTFVKSFQAEILSQFKDSNEEKYSTANSWSNSNKPAIYEKSSDIKPSPRSRMNLVDEDHSGISSGRG